MISKEMKLVLNKLSNGVVLLDLDKKIIFANDSVKTFFRGKNQEVLGSYLECDTEVFKERICNKKINCHKCFLGVAFNQAVESKKEVTIEGIKFFEDTYEINIDCKLVYDTELNMVILEFLNINSKYEKFNFFMKSFETSRDIVFFKNINREYIYINETGKKFFGNRDVLSKLDEDLFSEDISKIFKSGDLETLEKGVYKSTEFIGEKVFRTSKEFINGGILGVSQDITDEYYAQLSSNTDFLTGLFNRKKFEELYQNIFKKKEENTFLVIIDMDNLKNINNKHGHLLGDKYLKQLSSILENSSNGTFFRIGGDEFAALIQGEINSVENILKNIYLTLNSLKLNPKLTVSMGAKKIDLNKSPDTNYDTIDKILYKVKRHGKNRFIIE